MKTRRLVGGLAALATVVSGTAFVALTSPANAGSATGPGFNVEGSSSVVVNRNAVGRVNAVEPKEGKAERPSGVAADAKPEVAAKAYLSKYAKKFGVDANSLKVRDTSKVSAGSFVKADQLVDGVPVAGGEVIVSMDSERRLQSLNGETTANISANFPSVSANGAAALEATAVKAAAAKAELDSSANLSAENLGQQWYDASLFGAPVKATGMAPTYKFEVRGGGLVGPYIVYVNAENGAVELIYSNQHEALNRVICDAESQTLEAYECDGQAVDYARTEGQGPSNVEDVNKVYDFYYDTAVRFASYTNVDVTKLIGVDYNDGQGKALRATIRLCVQGSDCPWQNAAWDGRQMVFGEGVTTDDITGHELAHGVTQHTSDLAYIWQSGAINEGLSDFWGEIVDQNNGSDDDNDQTRWQMGEGSSLGVIRDMQDPTVHGQPDMMTSELWEADEQFQDNGGVHYNSGVFNKAGYLLVDGDNFNGFQINGLGPAKASKIVWTLQNLLTSGADYKDVFVTLPIACQKNIGDEGSFITEADCAEVDKVVRATEMYKESAVAPAQTVAYCESGNPDDVNPSYVEGFESSSNGWSYGQSWSTSREANYPYAAVGKDSAMSNYQQGQAGALQQDEAVEIPEGSFLRFDTSYLLNPGDQAQVEYNAGNGWQNAADLPNENGGQFVGLSNGYGGVRYDLSSLAGQSVQFRFSADAANTGGAWWIDNMKVYTCNG